MAVITLTANTNYSALSVADGDTIELNNFQLTLDVNPTAQNIIVTAVGNNGTLLLGSPSVFDCIGWQYFGGNVDFLGNIPADKTLGGLSLTASATNNIRGIVTLDGTFLGDVYGGSAPGSNGCVTNNGTIGGSVFAGAGSSSHGCNTNNGRIMGNSTGGSGATRYGCNNNNGTILGSAIGGSQVSAFGVNTNNGNVIGGIVDNTAVGISVFRGSVLFVTGAGVSATIPATIKTIYSLFGPLAGTATIDAGTTVVELTTDTAPPGFSLSQLIN